jgi:hypothetical protein
MVEQARGDVDRVAEDVARHLDHLAVRERDLQLQGDAVEAGRRHVGTERADARQRIVHLLGGRGALGG